MYDAYIMYTHVMCMWASKRGRRRLCNWHELPPTSQWVSFSFHISFQALQRLILSIHNKTNAYAPHHTLICARSSRTCIYDGFCSVKVLRSKLDGRSQPASQPTLPDSFSPFKQASAPANGTSCGADAPCCSSVGYCGASALHCGGE